jgi:hypothetical protein
MPDYHHSVSVLLFKLDFSPLITHGSVPKTFIAQGSFENLQTLCGLQTKLKINSLIFIGANLFYAKQLNE